MSAVHDVVMLQAAHSTEQACFSVHKLTLWTNTWAEVIKTGSSRDHVTVVQRKLKDTLNKGQLSNEDTVCSPDNIELRTNLPLN